MSSYNSVTLLGNLGADPEATYLPSGKMVCNLRICVNEQYTSSSGLKVHQPHWFPVQCWEKTAELAAQYLAKGSRVLVDGRLKTRSYEKDGVRHYVTEVVAGRLVFLDSVNGAGAKAEAEPDESPEDQGELPF